MWSTENQQYVISSGIKGDLYAYITAIIKAKNGKVFAIDGASDHLHLLVVLPPEISLSMLLGHVKACSSKWLKSLETVDPRFSWQNGYLAISTQEDRIDGVCSYIRSDEVRHQSKSYSEELVAMLNQQNIGYNEKYFLQNSHSKVYVHAIWSTHNRIPLLDKQIRYNLYNQMTDVVVSNRGNIHAIGGVEDHVHILLEMPKDKALSDLVREVKTAATHWLKDQDRSRYHDFAWQIGYGAFTVSYSGVEGVKSYIQEQEMHHHKKTSKEEWDEFLVRRGAVLKCV